HISRLLRQGAEMRDRDAGLSGEIRDLRSWRPGIGRQKSVAGSAGPRHLAASRRSLELYQQMENGGGAAGTIARLCRRRSRLAGLVGLSALSAIVTGGGSGRFRRFADADAATIRRVSGSAGT